MEPAAGFDVYSPREIAERVEGVCVAKAATPLLSLVMLGMLAGAFIGLGSLFYVIVVAQIGAFAWGLGYAILAARRVYGSSAARTIAKGAAIAILYATVAAPILLATVFLAAAVG